MSSRRLAPARERCVSRTGTLRMKSRVLCVGVVAAVLCFAATLAGVPAPYVCGRVYDGATRRVLQGVQVDAVGRTSAKPEYARHFQAVTDSVGEYVVAADASSVTYAIVGYDTLRVLDWTKFVKDCRYRRIRKDCIELQDVMLTPSVRRSLEKK